jgi:hypothetical protein
MRGGIAREVKISAREIRCQYFVSFKRKRIVYDVYAGVCVVYENGQKR